MKLFQGTSIKKLLAACLLVPVGVAAAPREAAAVQCQTTAPPGNIPAAQLVYAQSNAQVTATFCGGSAGYNSDLSLSSPVSVAIGTGNITPADTVVNLGVFTVGAELVFSIYVQNTGNTYFTGPGSRNPDGLVHAAITDLGTGDYLIGFEDVNGGGDKDYDDINVIVTAAGLQVLAPDADADGIYDHLDNCPNVANANQLDADADGMGDVCDICPTSPENDQDGDGACGDVDNCPTVHNPLQLDTDNDGTGDACELVCETFQRGTNGTVEDTHIADDKTTKNWGTSLSLSAGTLEHGAGANRWALLRFSDLSSLAGRDIAQASLNLKVQLYGGTPTDVGAVFAPWTESDATFDSIGQSWAPQIFSLPAATAGQTTSTDVTFLAAYWANSLIPNQGFVLYDSGAGLSVFYSSEAANVADRPSLDVCYQVGPCAEDVCPGATCVPQAGGAYICQ